MKKILLLLSLSWLGIVSNAQIIEIKDVKGSKFTGVNPIYSGEHNEIEGYCAYYMLEKEDKGIRNFEFSIIDKELTKNVKTNISIHKNAEINNVVFNGQFLLISIDDRKNKTIQLYVVNKDGEIVKEQTIEAEKKRLAESVVYADEKGQGFYVTRPIKKDKTHGYSLSKISNELEPVWQTEQLAEKGLKEVAGVVSSGDKLIVWDEYTKGAKVKPNLICFNAQTGDKLFERECYDGQSTLLYNNIKTDKDGYIYAGGAYVDGEKINGVNNAGIYLVKLDEQGKETLYTKVNNKEKIQDVLKATNNSFSLGSKDKVLVEDVIVKDDGIYIVSEMFRKNTNITPAPVQATRDLITGKAIGYVGGGSQNHEKGKVVMDIRDYIFFKFNHGGDLVEITPGFKEDNNKITCWYPYHTLPGMQLAKELQTIGWFDYAFQTKDKNGEVILVCKDNASGNKPHIYTYNVNNNYVKESINLKQQSKLNLEEGKVSYFNAIKNTTGKMVLVYYQRKLNTITLMLEDV